MQRNPITGRFDRGGGEEFEGFGVWRDSKGYPCIWIDSKGVRLHVYIWERANGSKPLRTHVHHKDLSKDNYTLENLQLVTGSEHRRIHAGWQRDDQGEWFAKPCTRCHAVLPLSEFYPRRGFTPSARCKPCTNIVTAAHNKMVPEKRRIYNQRWYAKRRGVMPNAKESTKTT